MANGGFVNIPFDPNTDALSIAGRALAPAAHAFGQGLFQPLEQRDQNDDVAAIKQWVDGGMEGAPPSARTPFGQELTGTLVLRQANEEIADPAGKTLRLERRRLTRESQLRKAQTLESGARAAAITEPGVGKGFTAGERSLFGGDIVSRIDNVKTEFSPGIKGRKQSKFIEEWKALQEDPTVGWENLSRPQRIQLWQMWNSALVGRSKEDSEIQWDPTSSEVQKLKKEMFGTAKIDDVEDPSVRRPLGEELSKTLPEGITFQELAELAQGLDGASQNELLEIQRRFFDAQKSGDAQAIANARSDYQQAIAILRGRR